MPEVGDVDECRADMPGLECGVVSVRSGINVGFAQSEVILVSALDEAIAKHNADMEELDEDDREDFDQDKFFEDFDATEGNEAVEQRPTKRRRSEEAGGTTETTNERGPRRHDAGCEAPREVLRQRSGRA